jgi:hypothetical protein
VTSQAHLKFQTLCFDFELFYWVNLNVEGGFFVIFSGRNCSFINQKAVFPILTAMGESITSSTSRII